MAIDVSALGSITRSLLELNDRLREIALSVSDDDEVGSELREIERQLQTASRRLDKAMRKAVK